MDIADRNGDVFLRRLASADAFNEAAIACGSSQVKTPGSRSNALLCCVTRRDQSVGDLDRDGFR